MIYLVLPFIGFAIGYLLAQNYYLKRRVARIEEHNRNITGQLWRLSDKREVKSSVQYRGKMY